MNLDELTIGDAKKLVKMFPPEAQCLQTQATSQELAEPWKLGKNYLIRTVTMIQTGRLVAVTDKELVLENAAWIADTGRFADALESGKFDEVEPFPDGQVIIGRGAIIDAIQISVTPREQK